MYSGGTILTAWKAILFWYGGDRFWIVVFSFLSFSSQAFLIQPDSVVRVCAFWGVRDHRERARARRDSFESSCVVFWSFQRVKMNGIFFKGTPKSSAQISGPQHMNSLCCFWKTNLPIVSAIERAENSFIEDRLKKKCFTAKSDGQLLTRLYLSVPELLKHLFSEYVRRIL
jgi:hypothetical protein